MNRKIRALIVDDEMLAHKALRAMLKDDPEIEIIAECRSGREAVQIIREQSPDLVFLDIQMPKMDGFQVIEEVGIERMPITVFVTAYDKHALRAFEANALDYLLKPFDHDRFDTVLRKSKSFVRQQKLGEISENLLAVLQDIKLKYVESTPDKNIIAPREFIDRVVIKSGERIYFLKSDEIDWIEGAGDYLNLHSASGSHLIRETMAAFYDKLDSKKFLRIHRSTIVNIERIKEIHPLLKGEYVITLTGGKRLKSSRGYRYELQSLLNEAR